MTKVYWPRIAELAVIISFVLLIGLIWLWYFAGNDYVGMIGGWGFVPVSWSSLIVLGLMNLSLWVVLIGGIVWLVRLISDHS